MTPATGLSYIDVQQYLGWITKKARHDFRLPTAEEWAAMASPVLPHTPDPLFTDPSLSWASSYLMEGLAPRALNRRAVSQPHLRGSSIWMAVSGNGRWNATMAWPTALLRIGVRPFSWEESTLPSCPILCAIPPEVAAL